MNRSKLSLALLAAAIAALGLWLWSSRGGARSDSAAPRPVSKATEPRAEVEPVLAAKSVEEPRQDAREAASAGQAPAKASAASHDFTVRGHVYARGTRAPIAGADIALCESGDPSLTETDGEPFARTASDEHGAFELPLVGGAPNRFALLATHEDFAPTWLDTLPSDVGEVELDVELDTHFFVGVDVWSPGARSLVFGADVRLSSAQPASVEQWLQDVTDAHGHCEFEVTGLPRTGLELLVGAEECAPWVLRDLTVEPGVQRRDVICHLEAPRRVHGRVVDGRNQRPIEGAELEIVGRREDFDSGGGEALSDANGEFELEFGFCPVEFASVFARAKGFRAARFDQLEPYAAANHSQLLIELAAPGSLRGTIRASDGQPVNEASIDVRPGGLFTEAGENIGVEADGSFEVSLAEIPVGPARVTCAADGCVTKIVDILVSGSTPPLDITLDRALFVSGRVMRASDSAPMPNVRVRLLAASGASWITLADGGGRYSFYASPKDVAGARLMVELGGRRLAVSELPAVNNKLELEHDISVAVVAPSKAR